MGRFCRATGEPPFSSKTKCSPRVIHHRSSRCSCHLCCCSPDWRTARCLSTQSFSHREAAPTIARSSRPSATLLTYTTARTHPLRWPRRSPSTVRRAARNSRPPSSKKVKHALFSPFVIPGFNCNTKTNRTPFSGLSIRAFPFGPFHSGLYK